MTAQDSLTPIPPSLVNPNWGIGIYPFPLLDGSTFCCGLGNSVTNECFNSTRGSSTPFPVQAGRVIFNRASGSTSPNTSETVSVYVTVTASDFALPSTSDTVTLTVTVTATVTARLAAAVAKSGSALPTNSDISTVTITSTTAPSTTVAASSNAKPCHDSPSSSPKPAAVGFGVGAPLGVALLGAFALIQRQKTREVGARKEALDARREARGARREAHAWEKKYDELQKETREAQMYELGHDGWRGREELDGRRL